MELYIYDKELNCIGLVDVFETLIWNRCYYTHDSFELHTSLNSDHLSLLKEGRIIVIRRRQSPLSGYIHSVTLTISNAGKEMIVAKGNSLLGYLKRRINWGIMNFEGNAEEAIRELVNNNAISTEPSRRIENLCLGDSKGFEHKIKYQNRYGNIADELESLSKISELGCEIELDERLKRMVFNITQGANRGSQQNSLPIVVFSRDFDNILSQEFYYSTKDFRNVALIAGEGEGKERVLTSVGEGEGVDRYELFVDARDLRKEVNDLQISDQEYKSILSQRGQEKLVECPIINTFESQINPNANHTYLSDYNLGDIVAIIDRKWGVMVDVRITEIEEVYENGKIEITPTFGHQIPSLFKLLNKR